MSYADRHVVTKDHWNDIKGFTLERSHSSVLNAVNSFDKVAHSVGTKQHTRKIDLHINVDTYEWINEVVTYIPPFIRSVTQSQSGSQYIPQTNWWAAYLEGAHLHCRCQLLFPSSFIWAQTFLFFFLSFIFLLRLPTYIHLHFYGACWLSVRDRHSLNTNYYGTTFGGVPDLLIPYQIECMCGQNRPRFIVPSERHTTKIS